MKKIVLITMLVAAATSVKAQIQTIQTTESWYIDAGIGYSVFRYPSALQEVLDNLKELDNVTNTPIDMNFGVYANISEHITLGGVFNIGADRYESDNGWVQYNYNMLALSSHIHLNKQYNGLFFRTDLGSGWLSVVDSDDEVHTTDKGIGFLVGIGFAFPISKEARVAPYVNFENLHVDNEDYSKIAFGVSIIF
ncbi:autotransporter domain-containing protein [bacterium]|nr:MAG: autotransporter domain-containing protein [bacterium]